jgi:tRNA threonylcarbamoyladenosine biosynthesis protein TsaE
VRGLAKGISSVDRVASPTFTISKVYHSDNLEIHHFDFYRLQDAGLLEHELADFINDPKIVLVIEWGDVVQHVLPSQRLTIRIIPSGDEQRKLEFTYPESLKYMVEGL